MLFLAVRHIVARKKQSTLTMLGVALGCAAFISFAALMTGFQGFIIDQLVNNDAHVKISAKDKMLQSEDFERWIFPKNEHVFWISEPSGRQESSKIQHPLGWYERLSKDPRVLAYAPQIGAQVLFTKGAASQAGRLQGVSAEAQARVTNIEKYMVEGSYRSISASGQRVVVGIGLVKRLGAKLGDTILVSSGKYEPVPFKISGIFKLGITNLDETYGFASLSDVQSAIKRPSEISDIAIRLVDVNQAQTFASQYQALTEEKVQSWDQANANILSVFAVQDFTRYFVTVAILVVAAFGIYNILNILVNQKRKEIGILRSIGFDGNDIVNLFMIQGLILGIVGGFVGGVLGLLMSLYLTTLKIGGMVDAMRISFSLSIYLFGFLMAVGASIVSSWLPAREAGKLRPIDIVRSGD